MTTKPLDSAYAFARILEWDSEFFGQRIARVEAAGLVLDAGASVVQWCKHESIKCAYLIVDSNDQKGCDAALAQSFRLVDLRVTLGVSLPPLTDETPKSPPVLVRSAMASDINMLKAIARVSHRDTRFYVDDHFDRERCDELYAVWIEKSFLGWAEQVFVAEVADVIAGYITCHSHAGLGEIGLIGVGDSFRQRGIGLALGVAAGRWFGKVGDNRVSVVTSGRNAAALALYQKLGFRVSFIQYSFHKWF